MKLLRKLSFTFAILLFAGSVFAFADGVKNNNAEQVVSSVVLAGFATIAPAVVAPGAMGAFGINGGFTLTRAEQHLLAFLQSVGRVDAQTAADYINGKLRFISANFYIRKKITGLSGIQPILDERDNRATGLTNLHQGKLDKSVNAVIDRIIIGYATHATEVDPKALASYDSTISTWPAGLRSGELIIKQDGNRLQDPIPHSMCGSQADSFMSFGKVDSYQLNTPIVLEEQKQIVLELDLPVASFAANQHHVEVFLLGSKTKMRSTN